MNILREYVTVISIALFIAGLRCDEDCGLQNSEEKIIGGNATGIDEYPWTALLRFKEKHSGIESWGCAGSLVDKRIILTAAHCVDNIAISKLGELQFVRLGEYDYNTEKDCVTLNGGEDCTNDPMDIKVMNIVIHPDRRPDSRRHDIAILILETVPPYTEFIRPICLPTQPLSLTDLNNNGGVLIVAGWGWTIGSLPSPSSIKLQVQVNYVNNTECQRYNTELIDQKLQICAGGKDGRTACRGDSGGPLMYSTGNKWILAGIVSFGPEFCGRVGFDGRPTVFTQTSGYLPWIKSVLLSIMTQGDVMGEVMQ